MSDRIVFVSVGNTRTRIALAINEELDPSRIFPSTDVKNIVSSVCELLGTSSSNSDDPDSMQPLRPEEPGRVVIATVNRTASDAICKALRTLPGFFNDPDRIARFGDELAIPVADALIDNSTVGQDRLLDALGAFARSRQACVVVDAGTAITVDFIDGTGTFQGGAIAPGISMMAKTLHEHTSALPEIDIQHELEQLNLRAEKTIASEIENGPAAPAPFGKTTAQAIAVGVVAAARGLVRQLVEKYAEFYGAYPRVVATGGDAPLLFQGDDLIEAIVPDLTLVGMLEAVKILRAAESADED